MYSNRNPNHTPPLPETAGTSGSACLNHSHHFPKKSADMKKKFSVIDLVLMLPALVALVYGVFG